MDLLYRKYLLIMKTYRAIIVAFRLQTVTNTYLHSFVSTFSTKSKHGYYSEHSRQCVLYETLQ